MPIPVNIPNLTNAIPFAYNGIAVPINVCAPPKEGPRCVPMQFTFPNGIIGSGFNATAASYPYTVDMGVPSTSPSLSQVVCMFIDNSQMNCDIVVNFPDTGYSIIVPEGATRLTPCLTGKQLPKFIVAIADQNDILEALGTVNIIANNIFIPSFESGDIITNGVGYTDATFQEVLNFPPGSIGTIYYARNTDLPLAQTTPYGLNFVGTTSDITDFTSSYDQWINFVNPVSFLLDSIDVSIAAQTTDNSTQMCEFILYDQDLSTIYSKIFSIGPAMTAQTIIHQENLKMLLSSGNFNTLQAGIVDLNGEQTLANIEGNITWNLTGALISSTQITN